MRILVLGAGGLGGYYGGRLAQAGIDVTFLVRDRRAAQLAEHGLVVVSPVGDFTIPVATVTRETARPGYDAILLSCKAYDLDDAIASIRPAAEGAMIVPVLNGLKHLDALDAAFGAAHVVGGLGQISATLDPDGTVRHLARGAAVIFGPRSPEQAAFCTRLAAAIAPAAFDSKSSDLIMQDMWEKFVFLCTLATMSTLMRGNVAAIVKTDFGASVMLDALGECVGAAEAAGHAPREAFAATIRKTLTDPGTMAAASMMRDMLRGGAVEAEHIVGDMLLRARAAGLSAPILRAAYTQLQVYEAGRAAG